MLKRIGFLLAILLALSCALNAAPIISRTINFTSNTSLPSPTIDVRGTGIGFWNFRCYPDNTVTAANVKLEQSSDNITWTDLIANVSCSSPNSASATPATATTNRVRATVSSYAGSGNIAVWIGGYIDLASSSGSGITCTSCVANQLTYATNSTTITSNSGVTYNPSDGIVRISGSSNLGLNAFSVTTTRADVSVALTATAGITVTNGASLNGISYPSSSGSNGYVLTSNGSGTATFAAVGGGTTFFQPPNGRLTTESGVPISITDRTSQGTLIYTPYQGSTVVTYTNSAWTNTTLSEISLSLTITSGKNYDVFLYNNSGTLTLELSAAWTNDTTRATALGTQDGIFVLAVNHSRLWLGVIRASGSNVTEDSIGGTTTQVGGKGYICNYYNPVLRPLKVIDTTLTWSYTIATIRQADAASGNKVETLFCDPGQMASAVVTGAGTFVGQTGGARASIGIGVDSTTVYSGIRGTVFNANAVSAIILTLQGQYSGSPGIGYHYFAWCESGANNTSIFAGNEEKDQAGLIVNTFR